MNDYTVNILVALRILCGLGLGFSLLAIVISSLILFVKKGFRKKATGSLISCCKSFLAGSTIILGISVLGFIFLP